MPSLNDLPDDLLLHISKLLEGKDLVSFSQTFQAVYHLSFISVSFWKYDNIIPGLLQSFNQNAARAYRVAAIRGHTMRNIISQSTLSNDPKVTTIEFPGRPFVECYVPRTQWMFALVNGGSGNFLSCIDLQTGRLLPLLGWVPRDPQCLDVVFCEDTWRKTGNSEFEILLAFPTPKSNSPTTTFTILHGIIETPASSETTATENPTPSLKLEEINQFDITIETSKVVKMVIHDPHVILEVKVGPLQHQHGGFKRFVIAKWRTEGTPAFAVWQGPPQDFLFSWVVVKEILLATYHLPGGDSQLYTLPIETLYKRCSSTAIRWAPSGTPYPEFKPTAMKGVYRISSDQHLSFQTDEATVIPTILFGLAVGEPGNVGSRIYSVPIQVPLSGGIKEYEKIDPPQSDKAAQIPYRGPTPIFTAEASPLSHPTGRYATVGRLSNGIAWMLCDERHRITTEGVRDDHGVSLFICDTIDPHASPTGFKWTPSIPDGCSHFVDMEVGIVGIVREVQKSPIEALQVDGSVYRDEEKGIGWQEDVDDEELHTPLSPRFTHTKIETWWYC